MLRRALILGWVVWGVSGTLAANEDVQSYRQGRQKHQQQIQQVPQLDIDKVMAEYKESLATIQRNLARVGLTENRLNGWRQSLREWLTPRQQILFDLMHDPDIIQPLDRFIRERHKLKTLAILQILVLVFMFVFRSYLASQTKGFWPILWLNIWTFFLFTGVSSIILPSLLYGWDYLRFLKALGLGLAQLFGSPPAA